MFAHFLASSFSFQLVGNEKGDDLARKNILVTIFKRKKSGSNWLNQKEKKKERKRDFLVCSLLSV
jgi:hypothetical protein